MTLFLKFHSLRRIEFGVTLAELAIILADTRLRRTIDAFDADLPERRRRLDQAIVVLCLLICIRHEGGLARARERIRAQLRSELLRHWLHRGWQEITLEHLLVINVHERRPSLCCVVRLDLQILQSLDLLAHILLEAVLLRCLRRGSGRFTVAVGGDRGGSGARLLGCLGLPNR